MSNPHKYRQWCSLYLFSRIIKTLDVEFILKLIYEDNLLVSLNDGINGSYISKTYAHKCTLRLLQTNSPEIISDVLRSDLFSSAVDFLVENPPNGVENLLETLRYSLQALQNTPELLKMTVEHLHEIGFVELYQGLKEDQPEDIINFFGFDFVFDIKSC